MIDNYSTAESGCEHLIMICRLASITVLGALVVVRAALGHGIEIIEYPERVLHIIRSEALSRNCSLIIAARLIRIIETLADLNNDGI